MKKSECVLSSQSPTNLVETLQPVIDFQLDEILEDDQPLYRRSRLSTAGDQFYLFFNQKSKQWSVTTEKTESSNCITSQSAACTTVESPSLPKL